MTVCSPSNRCAKNSCQIKLLAFAHNSKQYLYTRVEYVQPAHEKKKWASIYLLCREQERRRLIAVPLLEVPSSLGIPAELHQVALVGRDVGVDPPGSGLGAAIATAAKQRGREEGREQRGKVATHISILLYAEALHNPTVMS